MPARCALKDSLTGDPEIRRKALFWLGQSEDPRALALFEELLTRR